MSVRLRPGSKRGTWTGSADLGPGRWALTATITGSAEGIATRAVSVAEPPPTTLPPRPTPSAAPAPAAAPGPGRTPGTTSTGLDVSPVLGGLIALLAVGAVAGFAITRLRRGPDV